MFHTGYYVRSPTSGRTAGAFLRHVKRLGSCAQQFLNGGRSPWTIMPVSRQWDLAVVDEIMKLIARELCCTPSYQDS